MAASTAAALSPAKARRPEIISKRTAPKAHMSARASAGLPSSCSGAMYGSVPTSVPGSATDAVAVAASVASSWWLAACSRARPKSSSLAPARVSITFAGLRSRWMMPRSWAAARAPAIWRAIVTASRAGSGPRASRSASVSPSRYSMTRKWRPVVLADVEEGADVGVGEGRHHSGLALEASPQVRGPRGGRRAGPSAPPHGRAGCPGPRQTSPMPPAPSAAVMR